MNENILRKVRALLAQAESPACTPQEAEAFSARASELVAKYTIDQALLDSKAETGVKPTSRDFTAPAPYSKPKMYLAAAVSSAFGLSTVVCVSKDTFRVFGFQSDLEAFDLLYTSLLVQGTLASTLGDKSYRTSFWYAYSSRLHKRLSAQREVAAEDAGAGTALVLVNRKREVDAALATACPRTRNAARPRVTSASGLRAGQAAADRADLGTGNRVGGRTPVGAL